MTQCEIFLSFFHSEKIVRLNSEFESEYELSLNYLKRLARVNTPSIRTPNLCLLWSKQSHRKIWQSDGFHFSIIFHMGLTFWFCFMESYAKVTIQLVSQYFHLFTINRKQREIARSRSLYQFERRIYSGHFAIAAELHKRERKKWAIPFMQYIYI